ncbi:MAG: DEAD/DEAH box helicase family protein [Christensenellaceae bacterium]|nr:DEAD/DEAH box helicase family protein [Christensenellaceae bacterium]
MLNEVLDKVRAECRDDEGNLDEKKLGNAFETMVMGFIATDPIRRTGITEICLWKDFPQRHALSRGQDTGIDIVAKTKNDEYIAIQCKCYKKENTVTLNDISNLFALASRDFYVNDIKYSFAYSIVVASTDKWSPHAENAFQNQNPPAIKISLTDLENSGVDWEKIYKGIKGELARPKIHKLFDYQEKALKKVCEHLKDRDRCKLIMACGAGKTLVALHAAMNLANETFLVLYCVPSISLESQILREWHNQSEYGALNAICVCSDDSASKSRVRVNSDLEDIPIYTTLDLSMPASTNAETVYKNYLKGKDDKLTVIFTTYQSIDVITEAQRLGLPRFDLIICDEAHRTTGIGEKKTKQGESKFLKVHKNENVDARLRLYMTATPKILHIGEKNTNKSSNENQVNINIETAIKNKTDIKNITLYSMSDVKTYGEEAYKFQFVDAVKKERLTDYKVVVLTINEDVIPYKRIKEILNQEHACDKTLDKKQYELELGTSARLLGSINVLSKIFVKNTSINIADPGFMKRALAFCQNIATSKVVTKVFNELSEEFMSKTRTNPLSPVLCKHIDGGMRSSERDQLLGWLKGSEDEDKCKILSNVRCLTEGIDVPALDAIIFLAGKQSTVEIVQAVGRVMRKAHGKNFGYIIIPIIVPSFKNPTFALDESKMHKKTWEIVNALRTHDPQIDVCLQISSYNSNASNDKLIVDGVRNINFNYTSSEQEEDYGIQQDYLHALMAQIQSYANTIIGRLVENAGPRILWSNWASNIMEIANRHIEKLTMLFESDKYKGLFENFVERLSKNANNTNLTKKSVIEMLAQHRITEPIFNALFKKYEFAKSNPISIEIDVFLTQIEEDVELTGSEDLKAFYDNVTTLASGINNPIGRQAVIVELYNSFFKNAFPETTNNLGIVYTPIPIVDFIIKSTEDVLKTEFGMSLTDEGVNIIDPFTGTGTFIARLFNSDVIDVIKDKDLERKYTKEIYANEIVLLAYYIASVNIENEYYMKTRAQEYKEFEGTCLTDTFEMGEHDQITIGESGNAQRLTNQRKADIKVIISNPPYAVHGNKDEFSKTITYEKLDTNIKKYYVKDSTSKNTKSLYDSYIKAFRWATDRIDDKDGIIAYVTNGSWLRASCNDALRKSFAKEFYKIYVYDLRGDARNKGVLRQKEGDNVFGEGSRAPIAITLLVKKKGCNGNAQIHYCDIGDYLKREAKFKALTDARSFLSNTMPEMVILNPNEHGDWLKERKPAFKEFYPLAPNKPSKFIGDANSIFAAFTLGITSSRDDWVLAYSKHSLETKMRATIDYYNKQVDLGVINKKDKNINWDDVLKRYANQNKKFSYDTKDIRLYAYRPFCKNLLYFSQIFNQRTRMFKSLFPTPNTKNLIISMSGISAKSNFSVLISNQITDFGLLEAARCFPRFCYTNVDNMNLKTQQLDLFFDSSEYENGIKKHDGISDYFLNLTKNKYSEDISKDDIFYYVYGILHNRNYATTFKDDLQIALPRIPLVDSLVDFKTYVKAGRELANLHLNYENLKPLDTLKIEGVLSNLKITKMKFPSKKDMSTIVFNEHIKITNIPKKAHDYVLSGRSAIGYILEYYQVKTNEDNGICQDPNEWCDEVNNPRYILDLLLSIITLSVKTMEIVDSLPALDLSESGAFQLMDVNYDD